MRWGAAMWRRSVATAAAFGGLLLAGSPASSQVESGCAEPNDRTVLGQDDLQNGAPCRRWRNAQEQAARTARPRAPSPISPALQAAIRSYMEVSLIDSTGTRWFWPTSRHNQFYCGWINGRNRMGGYVGWKKFLATFQSDTSNVVRDVSVEGASGHSDIVLDAICRDTPPPR